MATKVEISRNLISEVELFVDRFGFESEADFVNDAIKEKILALKRDAFIEATDKVAEGLKRRRISEKEILSDFEKSRG